MYKEVGSLSKSSCLAPAIGATKFTNARYDIGLTLMIDVPIKSPNPHQASEKSIKAYLHARFQAAISH